MTGEVGILNVGSGDIRLSFDPKNPGERLRAARIVKDMLRRGYILGVETSPGVYDRAVDFDEARFEYIIWDYDPMAGQPAPAREEEHEEERETTAATAAPAGGETQPTRRPRRTKRIPAESARTTVAVGRSAGG